MRGCNFVRAVPNTYRRARQLAGYIDDGFDRHGLFALAVATKIDHSLRVCTRNAAEFTNRNPVFGERSSFLRIQKSVSLLVPEQASLNLHVCAVVVRQGGAPIQTIFVTTPRPDLLRREIQR